ncbi:glutamate--tRNA ligase [Bartonella sp. TP]|uniref:glutamate--tRNA ligase n=1 Tax=Bartonella sp. TP TaxID=3057550 RepID=UPI0025AFFD14|nr:glutamate--tRNA ligase [Bartonella sp. TP]MDN5248742.1 glutamate--tRNA ligase [Alphaproteobacteria bacterium]WJW79883.1 glutamate--tRNA ligase [Bartonella sp. TP]
MSKPIITRFAPSPTGFLHIGGARTALFNWAYAKHMGGKMLLRIEDTDLKRSTQEAVDAIISGLKWLGIDWSGEPISQFSRKSRHQEIAIELVKQGRAYYCYASKEEIAAVRADTTTNRYASPWRNETKAPTQTDIKPVIRIKAPLSGTTIIKDLVQGEIAFQNKDLDDFIILRSDGTPTYMHAVVVDDHDMGITHIIRGDDHLTNTARQAIIYQAMKWEMPQTAHIPLIHGADGAKLSKRHGALGVNNYKDMGYLAPALINYLMRLGWSHGDDEIMSLEQIVKWFDIVDVNKSAAKFDFQKLNHINGYYIKHSENEQLLKLLIENFPSLLPQIGLEATHQISEQQKTQLKQALPVLKDRAKTLLDLLQDAAFILKQRPIILDAQSLCILNAENKQLLKSFLPILISCNDWSKENLNNLVKNFAKDNNVKLPTIAQPIRAALTGQEKALGIGDLLTILTKEEAIARIKDQLE